MSLPPGRRTANIRLSWQSVIGDALTVDTVSPTGAARTITVPVHHENPNADPDQMGDPKTTPEQAWVEVAWLDERAGRRGHSVVQVDVYVRIGAKDSATSDPFGIAADDVADTFEGLFSGIRPDGTFKGWIPVLDFSVTPEEPEPTDECIFIYNPGAESSWGQPVERRRGPTYGGMQRITLRYAMRLKTDATSGLAPSYT